MKTFDDFWDKLTEDEIWWDRIKYTYSSKDHRGVAQECYIDLLAQPMRWEKQDYQDFRRCYQKWLANAKPVPVKPQLQQVEEKAIPEVEYYVDEATHRRRLKEWYDVVMKVDNSFRVPRISKKEAAEEGDWLPKKGLEYHRTPDEIVLMKEAIRKASGEFYKDLRYIKDFQHFTFGEVSVFCASKEDADVILGNALVVYEEIKLK
jgi:hypothetical protein